jgi:hypothetical protein
MGKRRVFTPAIVAQIPIWRDKGLRAEEIAERIGCSLNTLRVRCSKLGISLRPVGRVEAQQSPKERLFRQHINGGRTGFILSLSQNAIARLRKQAALLGTSGSGLASKLIEAVAQDDLYEAVLDEATT